MIAVLVFIGFLSTVAVVSFVGAWLVHTMQERRRHREIEVWRRTRPRAPLKGLLMAEDSRTRVAVPIFGYRSNALPLDADPITGERIQYGWADSELREVAARPTEFFLE